MRYNTQRRLNVLARQCFTVKFTVHSTKEVLQCVNQHKSFQLREYKDFSIEEKESELIELRRLQQKRGKTEKI